MRGHLSERSPGVWLVRVDVGVDPLTGKRKQRSKVVRGTKRDAEAALAELLVASNRGELVRTNATVRQLLERWFAHAEGRLAASTLREYRRLAKTKVFPRFGALRVDKLSAAALDAFYDGLVAGGLSPRSVRQIHSVIRRAYTHGVRWGWVQANPAAYAEPPVVHKKRRATLTPQQILKALTAAEETDLELWAYLRTMVASGGRRGEVCALRLTDLDLDAKVIHVDRSITTAGGRVEKGTKTHGVRDIPIDAGTALIVEAHLSRLRARCEIAGIPYAPGRFVFSQEIGGSRPWHPDTVSHWWADLRVKAGLPKWARLHDLRHFYATSLIDGGTPIPVVSRLLGHADSTVTMAIYAHPVEGRDAQAAAMIGDLLDGSGDSIEDSPVEGAEVADGGNGAPVDLGEVELPAGAVDRGDVVDLGGGKRQSPAATARALSVHALDSPREGCDSQGPASACTSVTACW